MDSEDKKITFLMDKVKYPSDKFTVAMNVMDITKDDVFKYIINPENKYGFESVNDFENFILENLKVMMGGDAFVIHVDGGYDEYMIIEITGVEVEEDDYFIRLTFDIPEIKLKLTSDGDYYYDAAVFFEDADKKSDLNEVGEWFDDMVQSHFEYYGNKFGLTFSI